MSSVYVSLDLVRTPIATQSYGELDCKRCDAPLDFHQPDERLPNRLLGTCPECNAWFLIDSEAELMVLLPDEIDLRNASPGTAPPRRSAASAG
jgi:hypothetical protein